MITVTSGGAQLRSLGSVSAMEQKTGGQPGMCVQWGHLDSQGSLSRPCLASGCLPDIIHFFCPASCLYSGAATAPEMVTSLFDEGRPLPPSHPWDLLPDLTLLPPEDHATPAPSCCLCIAFQPWWLSQLPFSVNADCLVYYFYFSFLSLCLSYECVSCTCRSVRVETRGRFGDQFSPSTVRSVD